MKIGALAVGTLAAALGAPDLSAATLHATTVRAWNTYIAATEARINAELASTNGFLVSDFAPDRKVTRDMIGAGAISLGKLATADRSGRTLPVPDGFIAHWRGTVFLPGARLEALLYRLQHPESTPLQQDVVALRVLHRTVDRVDLAIRMTRRHVVTVTFDTEHAVAYRRHGRTRASSRSESRRIVEVENAGTREERTLPEGEDRGFLWRMNSYWRYEEVSGGVIVELESVTLSRDIPFGLGAIAGPVVDRIARESIKRTLQHIRDVHTPRRVTRQAGAQ